MAAGQISQLRWRIQELSRQVWVRVTAFAVLGAFTAVAGFALKGFIPDDLPAKIGADAIEAILQILASSMLAVTTFSLSILSAAYSAAGTTATPRAVPLLVGDSVSQTVLATFIGAFLFSLVSIILLKTEIYGESGRLVLFAVTILVVLVVVVSLLRWIDQLGRLGRVGDTLERVFEAADESFRERLESPWLGANPLRGDPPMEAVPVCSQLVGYLQHCDIPALDKIADENGLLIYVTATPGDFLHPALPAMHVLGLPAAEEARDDLCEDLRGCLTIRDSRDFRQDPRFGLQVLSEIGQRALSPSVNDPGTAKIAVGLIFRVLGNWREIIEPAVEFPRLYVPSLVVLDLMEESLMPIAWDGGDNPQVQMTLRQMLLGLAKLSPSVFAEAAAILSVRMSEVTGDRVAHEPHASRIAEVHKEIADIAQCDSKSR